jgi:UDP-N-acetylmuramate: L-alanyl-gamma-D-glutamyl-meso-diaminopimelate ligase
VILTSIEFDHADIYADLQAVKDAFRRLIELIPEDGTLLYNGKDANIRELLQYGKVKKKISYSNNKSDYMAKVVSRTSEGTVFQVFHGPIFMGEFFIAMTGDYNVMNATSVIGLADQLGWPVEGVREGLASFQGVRRRQEIIGEPRGITIIEDFAHHPTAVRETIQAIETKYAGRKVFSVFEPRSATSRRRVFQKEYVLAFKKSQEVLIAEAYDQGKIEAGDRFSSAELVADLVKEGCLAHSFSGADAIVDYLGEKAKPNDVILIMSNGGFDGIYQKLMTRLSR